MVWSAFRGRLRDGVRKMAVSPDKTSVPSKWSEIGVRNRVKIVDVVINCLLFTPLVVLFQVSACGLQDGLFLNYLPGPVGTFVLLALGLGIEFACSLWQQYFSTLVRDLDVDNYTFIAITRCYHYALAFANVCHYRGLSDIYYFLVGTEAGGALQTMTTTVAILCSIRAVRNILGPPLAVGVDSSIGDFFETSTYFRTKVCRNKILQDLYF